MRTGRCTLDRMRNQTSILAILSIITTTACVQQPNQEPESIAIDQPAIVTGTRSIKIPHLAPLAGGQATTPEIVISFTSSEENFPGWIAPAQLTVGDVIVGGRAWVRVTQGSIRLGVGTNTQVIGSDPGNGGVTPAVLSAPSSATTAVQLLSFSGARLTVASGTTYYVVVQSAVQSGAAGVAQLRGIELDVTNALSPQ